MAKHPLQTGMYVRCPADSENEREPRVFVCGQIVSINEDTRKAKVKEEDYIHKNGSMCTVYVQPGTEHFLEYLAKTVKAFGNHQYTKNLLNQLIQNQLVEEIDTTVPNYPQKNKAKHTTELGDNFLRYIEFK